MGLRSGVATRRPRQKLSGGQRRGIPFINRLTTCLNIALALWGPAPYGEINL